MARFKYLGERQDYVLQQGPCRTIKLPLKNGTTMVIEAPDQVNGFPINQDIGVEITDPRSLRVLRADVRFQEIV